MRKSCQLFTILALFIGNLSLSAQEPWPDSLTEINIQLDGKEFKIRMDVPALNRQNTKKEKYRDTTEWVVYTLTRAIMIMQKYISKKPSLLLK